MADEKRARPQNLDGNFFVDSTCIDCDTCRWLAPNTFSQIDEQSAVSAQPKTEAEVERALTALFACPTSSIGVRERPIIMAHVRTSFPQKLAAEVYYCGYHSESSFGATSYFVRTEEANILVDCPRYNRSLASNLEALGGVDFIFLTHKDDIADHKKYAAAFNAKRVIHEADQVPELKGAEIVFTEGFELVAGAHVIPVPGHTKGSAVLLIGDEYLFTGDHLAYSQSRKQLVAFRNACWYSWEEQISSMQRLAEERFSFVLPGHGRRFQAKSHKAMQGEMARCVALMKKLA